MNTIKELDRIIDLFDEYISSQENIDVVYSKKFGYTIIFREHTDYIFEKYNFIKINTPIEFFDAFLEIILYNYLQKNNLECLTTAEAIDEFNYYSNKYFIHCSEYDKLIKELFYKHAASLSCTIKDFG